MDARKLGGIAFFSGLSEKELKAVAQWTSEVTVPAGTELAAEGRFAHEFFVIEDGVAVVTKGGTPVAELGPGDFFGEIALIETERRTATVTASTPMRLVVMFEREFRQMESEMPAVADRIREAIRVRLSS